MAFFLKQSKFLGMDLKYGVYTYGALMAILTIYYLFKETLTVQDWIMFIGVSSPATALVVMQIIFSDKFQYAWANWYFSFLAFILATIYITLQILLILQLKSSIGSGQIRFRMSEAGNPLSPQLVSDDHLSNEDADFVRRGLEALP